MLKSLDSTTPDEVIENDVIVVGAGLAGLFLANQLSMRGLSVLVLESGTETQEDDTHPLNEVEMVGRTYMGATHGRFRGLGGTSARWGGALLPYLDEDLDAHPCGWHRGWRVPPKELADYLSDIEATFGVTPGNYDGDDELATLLPPFLPRLPKWPAFRKRNTANLFGDRIQNDPGLQVWSGATVTEIKLDAGRAVGVVARSLSGNHIEAKAPCVVLAAGAIETTRLLLLLDRAQKGTVFPPKTKLGAGFHDHLSAVIADLDVSSRTRIARLFGFRFVRGGMRNLRFELDPATRSQLGLPAAFLHVAFTRSPNSGFEGLRKVFQAVQQQRLPAWADIGHILGDAPWFARAVWWRAIEKRLYPPSKATYELHLVTEQTPLSSQRITLSVNQRDPFGLPLACINWDVTQAELASFRGIADFALERWLAGPIQQYVALRPRPEATVAAELCDGGGIYHPAGTTRIGDDPKSDVVDSNLCVHSVPGLRVLATSVFPSIGGSSPSLALLQLALRMADDIAHTASSRKSE